MEVEQATEIDLQIFKDMPKTELHAHLNGSLSQNTLQKLIDLKKQKYGENSVSHLKIPCLTSHNLHECFRLFSIIHELTDSLEAIYMATCDVIKEFNDDGVRYLELRTTPKDSNLNMTQDSYVEAVLKAISTCSQSCPDITVKLLLSVDRKRSIKAAEDTVKIAEKYFTSTNNVVGIDLSGNPTTDDLNKFYPVLEYAKKIGLKLAAHISEVPNKNEEVETLLRLRPDRLGHGTYLHPEKGGSVTNFEYIKELKIPLEICLTSNVISKTVDSYEEHHFPLLKKIDYPCVLCTDDKGVFNTTLSKEYLLASKYYSLNGEELFHYSYRSIDYTFSTNQEKLKLQDLWRKINIKYRKLAR